MNERAKIQAEIFRICQHSYDPVVSPDWLKNDFNDPVWWIEFKQDKMMKLDFAVDLEDGSGLTDQKNRELLEDIKRIIIGSGPVFDEKSMPRNADTIARRVRDGLRIVDYLLLRAASLKISRFGLSLLSMDDIRRLLQRYAENNSISVSIYDWPDRLALYLRNKIRDWALSPDEQVSVPDALYQAPNKIEMSISNAEVIKFREWLWIHGFYVKKRCLDSPETYYRLDTAPIISQIFRNTLKGLFPHFTPAELTICSERRRDTEFLPVPVRQGEAQFQQRKRFYKFLNVLAEVLPQCQNVELMSKESILAAAPPFAAKTLEAGRYRTMPTQVMWYGLEAAISFFLEHGASLLNCFVSLQRKASLSDNDFTSIDFNGQQLSNLLNLKKSFELSHWSCTHVSNPDYEAISASKSRFECMRSGKFLFDLLQILYGAMHLIIGSLTARRVSEILELKPDSCLDATGTHLIFRNRKSGSRGLRQQLLRPIPPLVERIVSTLYQFQTDLIGVGFIDDYQGLLCWPNRNGTGLVSINTAIQNQHFDKFCDFIETPTDPLGRRYYFRAHQCRRFFAIAFFWSGTPSGQNTLSWFLAHGDPEHLYRYISEDMAGAVLRSVKASTICDAAANSDQLRQELEGVLLEHFKTINFAIMTQAELEPYLEHLLAEGEIEVEPFFFEDASQCKHKMCLKITSHNRSLW